MKRKKAFPKNYWELSCQHCWHIHYGPIWMVMPDGHILQKCCKCPVTRTVHLEHLVGEVRHTLGWSTLDSTRPSV